MKTIIYGPYLYVKRVAIWPLRNYLFLLSVVTFSGRILYSKGSHLAYKTPKGTRDFYPEDMAALRHIFDIWERVCLSFGFEEYEGPMFEHLELYTDKSGQEIVSQLYNFQDKGGRHLALRPELTPTLARMINQNGKSLRLPVRWFSIPRLFRYERAQRGRLREFFQLNMDIVGTGSIWAEVDLISAVVAMLQGFGLGSGDFCVGISSRRLLSALLRFMGVSASNETAVYAALDKRAKVPPEAFQKMLSEASLSPDNASLLDSLFQCRSVDSLKTWAPDAPTAAAAEELGVLMGLLNDCGYGTFVELDLSVVRGLAYYTGIVFEVFDRARSLRAIAGGGRYDNLLQQLGGQPLTGVGFGIGDVVLGEMLKQKTAPASQNSKLDYFILTFGPITSQAANFASQLRARGLRVTYSLEPAKLKKQISMAQDLGAAAVIFYGSDRSEAGKFEVKNMNTGAQSNFSIDEL